MNDEKTVTVDLEDWREYRKQVHNVTEDCLQAGKPFEVVIYEGGSYLVTQGRSGYWIPRRYVHFNGGAK